MRPLLIFNIAMFTILVPPWKERYYHGYFYTMRSLLIFLSTYCFFLSTQAQVKKEFYDTQQIKLKTETDYYKGMPNGLHKEYYQSGKLMRQGYYKFGKEDSVWTIYYENGLQKATENYVASKKWGTNKYYYKTGKLSQIIRYENDLADSTWTSYFENGTVKSRESFEKGKK